MLKKKGVIEVVARNKKGIKIGEEWFGAFKVAQISGASQGDEVEFEYEQKGEFNNIKGNVKVLSAGSPPAPDRPEAPSSRDSGAASSGAVTVKDQQIIRQNSLTQANMLLGNFYNGEMGGQGMTPEQAAEEVISIARIFEQYSKGEV